MKLLNNIVSATLKIWQGYCFIRNSPEKFGPAVSQKLGVVLLYLFGICAATYMTIEVLTYSPLLGVLLEKDGPLEMPSLVICPPISKLYDYNVFWRRNNIKDFRLSAFTINLIAKAAKEGTLAMQNTTTQLKQVTKGTKAENIKPAELWQLIASAQYAEFKYDYSNPPESAGLYWYHLDFECWPSISAPKGSKVPQFYSCERMESIWLDDNSYCLLFNNTGHSEVHSDTGAHYTGLNRVQMHLLMKDRIKIMLNESYENATCHYPIDPKWFAVRWMPFYVPDLSYKTNAACYGEPDDVHSGFFRTYVGNLETEMLKFDQGALDGNPDGIYKRSYSVIPYKINKPITKVCQKAVSAACHPQILDEHWKFLVQNEYEETFFPENKSSAVVAHLPTLRVDVLITGSTYFEVAYSKRFNRLQMFQVLGNIYGIWTGLSMFLVIKVTLVSLRSLKIGQYHGIISAIQIAGFIILLIGAISIEWYDYLDFQWSRRFRPELDFDESLRGVPYPNLWISPRMMGWINNSIIQEHQISWKLLAYITATSALLKPNNWIMKTPGMSFFFWDNETKPEVGYHYEFMEFPLQYISQSLYDQHMTEVENEYAALATKLNIDPDVPSWEVLKSVMIQPCSLIKHCIINGKIERLCCLYFQQTCKWGEGPGSSGCGLELMNDKLTLRQTLPGKKYGFRIVINLSEMHRNFFPPGDGELGNFWLDPYLISVATNCSYSRNCSYGWRHAAKWRAARGMNVHINNQNFGFLELAQWKPGLKWHGKIQRVEVTQLSYNLQNKEKCSNKTTFDAFHKFAFLANELVKKRCGCHICMPPKFDQLMSFQNCCTPRHVGRCLTDLNMSEELCKKNNPNNKNKQINFRQLQYAGNLPSEAPIMPLLRNECDLDVLFFDPESSYYNDSKEYMNKKKHLFYPSCNKVEFLYKPYGKKSFKHDPNGIAEDNAEITIYYANIEQKVFRQRDLQNPWEIFGLFCGGLGIMLGVTYTGILELLIDTFNIKWAKVPNGKVLAHYGLAKLVRRFKTASVVTNTDQCKGTQEVTLSATIKNPTDDEHNENSQQTMLWPTKSDTTAQVLKVISVASGIGLAYAGCYQLQKFLNKDSIEVGYELRSSGVQLPALAVCIDRLLSPVSSFAEAKMVLHSIVSDCEVGEKNINCSIIFVEFFKNLNYYCIISTQKWAYLKTALISPTNSTMEAYNANQMLTLKIRNLDNAVHIWAGGIEEIVEGYIDVHKIVSGKNHNLRFQQWEIQTEYVCKDGNEGKYPCPNCDASNDNFYEFNSYCCADEGYISPNLTRNAWEEVLFCNRSFYTFTSMKTQSFKNETTVILEPETRAKHVVVRQMRRTYSEILMLYAGYVDVFVGINLDNLCYVLACIFVSVGSFILF